MKDFGWCDVPSQVRCKCHVWGGCPVADTVLQQPVEGCRSHVACSWFCLSLRYPAHKWYVSAQGCIESVGVAVWKGPALYRVIPPRASVCYAVCRWTPWGCTAVKSTGGSTNARCVLCAFSFAGAFNHKGNKGNHVCWALCRCTVVGMAWHCGRWSYEELRCSHCSCSCSHITLKLGCTRPLLV
jgi:hypothetical protein